MLSTGTPFTTSRLCKPGIITRLVSAQTSGTHLALTSSKELFQTWYPLLYHEYELNHWQLRNKYPGLYEAGLPSYYPWHGETVNGGKRCTCKNHRDHGNKRDGPCAVIVGGEFKHKLGGHLVLHDLKLILELQPGQVVLFPSAAIMHMNIPIGSDETRHSITLYSAAGLFRHVAYGFRSRTTFQAEDPTGLEALIREEVDGWEDSWRDHLNVHELKSWWGAPEPEEELK